MILFIRLFIVLVLGAFSSVVSWKYGESKNMEFIKVKKNMKTLRW